MHLKVPSTRVPVLSSHTALNLSSVKVPRISLPVKSLFAGQPPQARGNLMSQKQRVMGYITPSYQVNVNIFPGETY